MSKKKNRVKVFDVTIMHADGTVMRIHNVTVRGLFRIIQVGPDDLLTFIEKTA